MMEPIAVVPMTFQSPQFVLQVMLILLAVLCAVLAAYVVTKVAATPLAEKFVNPPFVITVLLLALVGFVLYMVFLSATPASNDVQVMVITAVVVTGLQEIRKYWLNSTSESEAKNTTIAQLSRTAAVSQDALLDPSLNVTKSGAPLASSTMPNEAGPPAAGAQPLQAENVTVNALNTNVNEVDTKGNKP